MTIKDLKFKEQQITQKSCLINFFVNYSTEKGIKYIEIYEDYGGKQNNLLKEITEKIKAAN